MNLAIPFRFVPGTVSGLVSRLRFSGRAVASSLIAAAAVLTLCSCAVIPSRPEQIPAFAPAPDQAGVVLNLAGRYANRGEAYTPKGQSLGPVFLSRLLWMESIATNSLPEGSQILALSKADVTNIFADSIQVMVPETNMLELQFFQGNQRVATRVFTEYAWHWKSDNQALGEPYYRVKNFVDVVAAVRPSMGLPVADQESDECLFRKAEDGSLIVLYREQFFEVILVMPCFGNREIWCRFPPQ